MVPWRSFIFTLILAVPIFAFSAEPEIRGVDGIKPEFELLDGTGATVSQRDFRDRYVLLAFGYTNCPHICPMMAANMAAALRLVELEAEGVFVSVDTERDTPGIVARYATSFGENMTGMGGSFQQVQVAARNFKVTYVVTKSEDSYTVQHTTNIFLLDPEGNIIEVFGLNARPSEMAAAIKAHSDTAG